MAREKLEAHTQAEGSERDFDGYGNENDSSNVDSSNPHIVAQ